ncbi:MAG: AAA family ATPase, partial [Actinomycetia bacterium]|nr:AAA family ATPase [Actinomycetes bacterium]
MVSGSRRTIEVPEVGLIVLCGASGSGKSTFARAHFAETEVVSSDRCRALVGDDENDQSVTAQAFSLLHDIVDKRLELGRMTVVDATNVKAEDRRPLVELARKWDVLASVVVLDLPVDVCMQRNSQREDRTTPEHAIRRQHKVLRRTARRLRKERFSRVHTFASVAEVEAA